MLLGALLLQVAVVVAVSVGTSDRPRAAPVDVVAPPIVAPALADRAQAQSGGPLAATVTDRATALSDLDDGTVVAVVLVDLTADRDRLLLSSSNGAALDRGVTRAARQASQALGRTLAVEHRDVGGPDRRVPFLVVAAALVGGFAVAGVTTWLRGSADSFAAGARRWTRFAAVSLAAGLVAGGVAALCGAGTSSVLGWAAVVALLVLVASTFTNALSGLWGLGGLAAASALFGVTAVSVLTLTSPYLLTGPWAVADPWLAHGAGLRIAESVAVGGLGPARSWAVLVAWAGLAALTASVARAARARETARAA